MNRIRNLFTSFGIAAAFAAIILVGLNPGIAKADDVAKTNVHLNVDSAFVQSLKPAKNLFDWYVTVYPLGTNTMTLSADDMYAREEQMRGQTLNWSGNHFGGAGIETGRMMLKGHFGENGDYVAGPVNINVGSPFTLSANFVAMTSYKPFPVTGTMANTTTGSNKRGGTTTKAKKAAAPVVLTPLCSAILPLAKTGGVAYVMSGGVFQGKVAFVLASNTNVLSVEAAGVMFNADGSNAVVRDFTGVPVGATVKIPSGAYQVFNLEVTGGLTPLGFLNAPAVVKPSNITTDAALKAWTERVAHTALNRQNADCPKYPVDMLAADPARTGSDDDWPGGLPGIVFSGIAGMLTLAWTFRRRQSANVTFA